MDGWQIVGIIIGVATFSSGATLYFASQLSQRVKKTDYDAAAEILRKELKEDLDRIFARIYRLEYWAIKQNGSERIDFRDMTPRDQRSVP